MRISEELKERLVRRMLEPGGPTPHRLSMETGVGKSTLWRWRKEAEHMGSKKKEKSKDKKTRGVAGGRSAAEKLRLVLGSEGLEGQELGEFLRREGVHVAELEQWKGQMLGGLEHDPQRRHESSRELAALRKEKKSLERELKRKESALAETAALLVLSKKARRLWGAEDASTPENND